MRFASGVFAVLAAMFALSAFGAPRTFVASSGKDTNPCTVDKPCRTFAAAITIPERTNVSGQDYLTLTFTRDLTATGVTLTVRASSDLSSWENIDPDGPNQISSTTNGSLQTLTVRDNVPMSAATSRFMQLHATEP